MASLYCTLSRRIKYENIQRGIYCETSVLHTDPSNVHSMRIWKGDTLKTILCSTINLKSYMTRPHYITSVSLKRFERMILCNM